MNKIFICSPYRGDTEKNIENVKRYCRYFSYDGIPIAPHLYFTQFLDEKYDRDRGMHWGKALLAECKAMYVLADEVTEGMIEEIQVARKLHIPIKFYNSDIEEIRYEALIINNRIGNGYKQIIEETVNPDSEKRICPYAKTCKRNAAISTEKIAVENKAEKVTNRTRNNWRTKFLAHFNRNH